MAKLCSLTGDTMTAQSTGWRSVKPVVPQASDSYTSDKSDLYKAARLAARVLNLRAAPAAVLDALVGSYGGKLTNGRMLVWPSNDFIADRSRYCERSVRSAISTLRSLGLIAAMDSANGKRFARRDATGKVTQAFGFDLSPLINRLSEFTDRFIEIKEREREREAIFDQITIDRRSAQEALRALSDQFPSEDIGDLTERALELAKRSPRRTFKGSIDGIASAWFVLREEIEARYFAACGGKNCRHKDNNTNAIETSCNKGTENFEETIERPRANLKDLIAACPDAIEFFGRLRSDIDLISGAGRLRGQLGVSLSAWEEARREIGPLPAAATLALVMQTQIKPRPGAEQIRNLGGYFRAMVRLIREGRVSIDGEIRRMLR